MWRIRLFMQRRIVSAVSPAVFKEGTAPGGDARPLGALPAGVLAVGVVPGEMEELVSRLPGVRWFFGFVVGDAQEAFDALHEQQAEE